MQFLLASCAFYVERTTFAPSLTADNREQGACGPATGAQWIPGRKCPPVRACLDGLIGSAGAVSEKR